MGRGWRQAVRASSGCNARLLIQLVEAQLPRHGRQRHLPGWSHVSATGQGRRAWAGSPSYPGEMAVLDVLSPRTGRRHAHRTKPPTLVHLERATKDWSWRADLLLPILDHFRDEDEALVSLDLDSMASLDVVFQTEKKTHLISILLATASSRDKHMFEFRSGYFVSLVFL